MSYEQVASVSQVVALIFFVVLFAGVLLYAFWPGNKKRFEEASKVPLEKDPESDEKDG
jgi:cytochrome c oxidase cbb3-type subunit 4